ncbi:MAG: YggS family pyridoxal phosphate-dependent enzyme [Candidatus Saelkia tenebricola]|nr:YggS family pyridoxal phosphate-dependent enzyme [Candidatus Saelkia tenebricola]
MSIKENYLRIREQIPEYVKIVLAAKMRTKEEIEEVIYAGAEIIGENYVQEAEKMYQELGEEAKKVKWHMIGGLQKNKINKALKIFDCIQTIDSPEFAEVANKRAEKINKIMFVFIEVNIGSEMTKAGVKPDYEIIEKLAEGIAELKYLRLEGLMTMGPRVGNPEDSRPYFRKTKNIFEKLKENVSNGDLKYLSMGMSNSYKIAIEEGANMVRLGTAIFGKRICDINGQ